MLSRSVLKIFSPSVILRPGVIKTPVFRFHPSKEKLIVFTNFPSGKLADSTEFPEAEVVIFGFNHPSFNFDSAQRHYFPKMKAFALLSSPMKDSESNFQQRFYDLPVVTSLPQYFLNHANVQRVKTDREFADALSRYL